MGLAYEDVAAGFAVPWWVGGAATSEAGLSGTTLRPHLYGPLNTDALIAVRDYGLRSTGASPGLRHQRPEARGSRRAAESAHQSLNLV